MKRISRIIFSVLGMMATAAVGMAHEGHEHVSGAPVSVPWGLEGLKHAANVHPVFVHFPIALFLGAALLYWLSALIRKSDLAVAGKWMLVLGAVSAAAAVWTGIRAGDTVPHDEAVHAIMMRHEALGYWILGIGASLALWTLFAKSALPSKLKWVFLLGLAVLAGLIVQTGDLGGRMVFEHGTGVRGALRVPESSHEAGHAAAHDDAVHAHDGHMH